MPGPESGKWAPRYPGVCPDVYTTARCSHCPAGPVVAETRTERCHSGVGSLGREEDCVDWQPQRRIATDRQQKKLNILFFISILSFMFLLTERLTSRFGAYATIPCMCWLAVSPSFNRLSGCLDTYASRRFLIPCRRLPRTVIWYFAATRMRKAQGPVSSS